MASGPQTTIVVALDDSKIRGQLSSMEDTFKRSWTEIASSINVAKQAISAVIGVGKGLYDLAKSADEAAMAETRAVASIRQYGGEATQTVAALKKYNESLQAKLGIDADNLIQMQGTLAMMGVHPSRLKEATEATIGLSEATGQDLDSAARMVAKALNGQFEALKKVGIYATNSDDAMRKLAMGFDVASQKAGTFTQKTNSLWHAMGDLAEATGAWISQNETIKQVADNLSYSFSRVASKISPSQTGTSAADFAQLSDARSGPMRLTGAQEDAYGKYAEQDKRAAEKAAQEGQKLAQRQYQARSREYEGIVKSHRDNVIAAEEKYNEAMRRLSHQREIDLRESNMLQVDLHNEHAIAVAGSLDAQTARLDQFGADMFAGGMAAASGLFDSLINAAALGQDASVAIADFLGGILRSVGQALIALGTATAAAAYASLPAPVAWAGTGGVLGIGAGLGIVAAGTALTAGGALISGFLGSTANPQGAAPKQPSGHIGGSYMRQVDRYTDAPNRRGDRGPVTINIEFNRPVGNPRRTAREIADMLRAGGALEGIGAG